MPGPGSHHIKHPPSLSLARGIVAIRIGSSGGAALLLIVDFLEIGVNDLVAARAAGRSAGTRPGTALRTAGAGFAAAALLGLVHRLAELHRDLRQGFGLRLDLLDILAADDILQRLDRALHRLALAGGNLVAGFLQCALA